MDLEHKTEDVCSNVWISIVIEYRSYITAAWLILYFVKHMEKGALHCEYHLLSSFFFFFGFFKMSITNSANALKKLLCTAAGISAEYAK